MHVPDGFLRDQVSIATGVVALGAIALATKKAAPEVREAGMARVSLTAALVFAAQMVNFQVAGGTSGHLIGAALAVALVGPWTAVLCLSAVLTVQAVVFADGGLTALGTNIFLMAIVAVGVAQLVLQGMRRALPDSRMALPAATFAAGLVSVPAAGLAFAGLYAVGGAAQVPVAELTVQMVGWHFLIGVGEAVISAALVLLLANAPAWVLGATALGAAAGLSLVASGLPDGLEHVAQVMGFADSAVDPATAISPFADYSFTLLAGPMGTAVAGVVGIAVVAVVVNVLTRLSARVG